jgi:hypothetical protein
MEIVAIYKYEANANFAKAELGKTGLESEVHKSDEGFELRTSNPSAATREFLESLELDDSFIYSEDFDYLEAHIEWSNKMYDPGHYTGGKIPHFMLDKSKWKYLILIFALDPLILLFGLLVDAEPNGVTLLYILGYGVLVFSMIWQLKQRTKKREQEKNEHTTTGDAL